jgi:HAMP domain-containing protein/type II secretory pathway pseudopilin PulG
VNLSVKFSLVLVIVFALGVAIAGTLMYGYLQRSARAQVVQQANLMLETAVATRQYTQQQITPLRSKSRSVTFHAQWVPAYAATQVFAYVHTQNPAYDYREPTLNPTNPGDRPTDWQADIINAFRADRTLTTFEGERDAPTGRSLVLAKPIVATGECMECHSTARAAPPSMVKQYGSVNGFGWKLGEIIGAQVVSVPVAVPAKLANDAFRGLIISFVAVALVMLIALNVVLTLAVTRPVQRLAATADDVSKGNLDAADFKAGTNDEIGILGDAFNRMRRSLLRALQMLE